MQSIYADPRSTYLSNQDTSKSVSILPLRCWWEVLKRTHFCIRNGNEVFEFPRNAMGWLGFPFYGTSMVGYTKGIEGIKLWVAKRNAAKILLVAAVQNLTKLFESSISRVTDVQACLTSPYAVDFPQAIRSAKEWLKKRQRKRVLMRKRFGRLCELALILIPDWSATYFLTKRPAGCLAYLAETGNLGEYRRPVYVLYCADLTYPSRMLVGSDQRVYLTLGHKTNSALFRYLYDLELSPSHVPEPVDGEVESFEESTSWASFECWYINTHGISQLLSSTQVLQSLHEEPEKWCWWAGLTTISFLSRHGIINRENEPHFDEIISMIHAGYSFIAQDHRIATHRAASKQAAKVSGILPIV
jgi:hypothetical protein